MNKKRVDRSKVWGLSEALHFLNKEAGRTLFIPNPRRYVPMRHAALARLIGGPDHPGLPTGTYIEIRGGEHSGKTTTTFAMIDAVINQPVSTIHQVVGPKGLEEIPVPRKVLFLDSEFSLDIPYMLASVSNAVIARFNGRGELINEKEANIYVHQPMTLEEAADIADNLIRTHLFGLVVMDSLASLVAKEEAEKPMGENTMGLQARALGKMFRKMTGSLSRAGTTVAMVNQWRDKIGVVFGDPRFAPGGKAKDFYDSVILDISGSRQNPYFPNGKTVRIKTKKNKVSGILGECSYYCGDGHGLSAEVELHEIALRCGVIVDTGENRPVYLLPIKKNGKVKRAKRIFKNRVEWLAALRNRKFFDAVFAKCVQSGKVDQTGEQFDHDGFADEK